MNGVLPVLRKRTVNRKVPAFPEGKGRDFLYLSVNAGDGDFAGKDVFFPAGGADDEAALPVDAGGGALPRAARLGDGDPPGQVYGGGRISRPGGGKTPPPSAPAGGELSREPP